MAFEVARLHGLICSNIKDNGDPKTIPSAASFVEKDDAPTQLCATQQTRHHTHFAPDLPCDCGGFSQWSESAGSPLESSTCSTETESDEEDDLLAGLAKQMAHNMLEEEDSVTENHRVRGGKELLERRSFPDVEMNKVNVSSPSSWSGGSWSSSAWLSGSTASSKGSSRVSSEVSSPQSTPSSRQQDAWDLLHAAAGEVVRLKVNEERRAAAFAMNRRYPPQLHNQLMQAQLPVQVRPSEQLVGRCSPSYSGRRSEELKLFGNQLQQNRAAKFASIRAWTSQDRPHPVQQQQSRQACNLDGQKVGHYRSGKLGECNCIQWTSGSAVSGGGSGMRAVCLGGGSGRESGGTGVFLPRSLGSALEHRKKNEYSA